MTRKEINFYLSNVAYIKSLLIKHTYINLLTLGENEGRLISPCKCAGSIQFIHVHCLEHSANITNNLYCDICKDRYPLVLRHKPLLEVNHERAEKKCKMFVENREQVIVFGKKKQFLYFLK